MRYLPYTASFQMCFSFKLPPLLSGCAIKCQLLPGEICVCMCVCVCIHTIEYYLSHKKNEILPSVYT